MMKKEKELSQYCSSEMMPISKELLWSKRLTMNEHFSWAVALLVLRWQIRRANFSHCQVRWTSNVVELLHCKQSSTVVSAH